MLQERPTLLTSVKSLSVPGVLCPPLVRPKQEVPSHFLRILTWLKNVLFIIIKKKNKQTYNNKNIICASYCRTKTDSGLKMIKNSRTSVYTEYMCISLWDLFPSKILRCKMILNIKNPFHTWTLWKVGGDAERKTKKYKAHYLSDPEWRE